jgi:general secretion pathway protein D
MVKIDRPTRKIDEMASRTPSRLGGHVALAIAAVLVCSCASQRETPQALSPVEPAAGQAPARPSTPLDRGALEEVPDTREEIVERGNGVLIGQGRAAGPALVRSETGEINFRFEGTDLREFVGVVLGDLLSLNYLVDPEVMGQVTVYTTNPVTEDQVLPLFEQVLSAHGAALVRDGTLYQVVPAERAARTAPLATALPRSGAPGFSTQVIPLRFISALEMRGLLQSVVPSTVAVSVDTTRNLVIASGSAQELQSVLDAVSVFDVDWLRGMSVGLYPLDNVDPRTLETELYEVLGEALNQPEGNVLGGQVRLVSLERLASLLVVSSTPGALREVELWIRRLDRPGESAGKRLYVYPVQNAKAVELADIVGSIFGSRASSADAAASSPAAGTDPRIPQLAPGLAPMQIGAAPAAPAEGSAADGGLALGSAGAVEIIADDVRNALVILASPQDYRMVESALIKLDVVPLQVLIEASILEVTLRDDLSYGVEWFFRNSARDAEGRVGALDLGSAGIEALAPGFSYSIIDSADDVRLALNLLEEESDVKILSSPSLMVIDNQTATISVGDEIPVPSRQSISNLDPISPTVNEISFRQTGVTLSVTPRVSSSGLVTMEISQAVAAAAATTTSNIDAPTIQNRQIDSVVAVNSGETIVLGGLIQDQRSTGESGVPFLRRIPGLGKLFGRTDNERARTELMVLITPRVVADRTDARAITDEFRRKLQGIEEFGRTLQLGL